LIQNTRDVKAAQLDSKETRRQGKPTPVQNEMPKPVLITWKKAID
jgi:hypothetical protein